MKEYLYTGKETVRFSFEKQDYLLEPGEKCTLPSDSGYVKGLVAKNLLEPASKKSSKPEPPVAGTEQQNPQIQP